MSDTSMNLQLKQLQNLKQIQRLIMSPQMQQAIYFLQVPILELSTVIQTELQHNPVLESEEDSSENDEELERLENDHLDRQEEAENRPEQELLFDDKDFTIIQKLDDDFRDYQSGNSDFQGHDSAEAEKLQQYKESSVQESESLFINLMNQARGTFDKAKDLEIAEVIIGNLDSKGFLEMPVSEVAALYHLDIHDIAPVLHEIQQFDPPGIAATSLQESLLFQLERQGKKGSLAHQLIEQHYEDLLHNRILLIQKTLKVPMEAINLSIDKDISHLDLQPGSSHSKNPAAPLTPDVTIIQEEEELHVIVNNDYVPSLRINRSYLRMLADENVNAETKDFIKTKILSAKWLMRNLFQRNSTLEKIAQSLSVKHKNFFVNPLGELVPLTMKTLADEISVHESTIARAVANKYINTPRGIYPLRFFFSHAYTNDKGEDISSKTVRVILHEMIDKEDKAKPLSDEALSTKIKAEGIPCARRTIAKYRMELEIGNAHQRKKFH